MLPFVASQAVALSQAQQEASKSPANGQRSTTPRIGKGFWSRFLEAMIESRSRRADIELRNYRGLHERDSNT
jgi:hypothetical protein